MQGEPFSLPNILLGESAETELLQDEVTPERIAQEALLLYRGEPHRQEVCARLAEASVPIERESEFTLYFRDPERNLLGLSHYPTPRGAGSQG